MALIIIVTSESSYSGMVSSNHQITTLTANFSGWQQVPIGGGGYVTSIYTHPQAENLVYMQTDNGGVYRWNPEQQNWHNILDNFPRLPSNDYGIEALALDPHNPELVYLALGMYTGSGNGKLWKSSDRGQTWIESDLQIPMGGNENKRWGGNRLAVSFHDSNILLFGSRKNGLWRSADGGIHWSQIQISQAHPDPEIGLIAVAFDPRDPHRVYLGAYGDGIYQSDDRGLTWKKMPGSPTHPMKMSVSGDGSLYVTSDISPGVSKYINSAWFDITPQGYSAQVFNGLSIHPHQSNQILVVLGEVGNGKIFYSDNGGNSWSEKSAVPQINPAVPWWPNYFFNDYNSAIVFDPHFPHRVWLSDWFGVWRTENVEQEPAKWTNYPQGQEQLVIFSLISPPQGAILLSGVADVDGFYHHDLATYPHERLTHESSPQNERKQPWDSYWQDTYSIAYCLAHPLNIVRVGGKRDNRQNTGATSEDGGITWQEFANFPEDKIPLRVAISAVNPQQFVVIRSDGQALRTTDHGKSWQPVAGLPNGIPGPWNWVQPLAADGFNGNKFYYYAGKTFYRSDNGGVNFVGINNSLPSAEDYILKTVPGIDSEVWLSLDRQGIYVSRDGGLNFTHLPQVEQSRLIAFGKSTNTNNFPALYLYGKVTNQGEGLFSSSDRGQTWHKLDNIPLGNHNRAKTFLVLEASQREPGLIFLGTNGRGIYYRYSEITK